MLYLNMDDLPEEYETFFFPGGEPHVKIPSIDDYEVFVRANIRNAEDFMITVALLDALKTQRRYVYLFCPYFPGARQDRNPGGTTPLTVDMYAHMLQPYVDMLIVFDVHSPAAVHYISKYFGHTRFYFPWEIPHQHFDQDYVGVIAPDKGAVDRAKSFQHRHFPGSKLIVANKVRDFDTGHITGYEIDDVPVEGKWLVIDDICDGGWTFNELAKTFAATQKGSLSEIHLYVSHGIFSKGITNIDPLYNKIYTTDSFDHPNRLVADRDFKLIPLGWIETQYR